MPQTTQLSLAGVGVTLDHHPVLTDVTTAFTPGTTTGVIGENGSGKSTLLRLLAGALAPTTGAVTVLTTGGLAHLAQDVPFRPDVTVAHVVDDALADLRVLERRLRSLERAMADGSVRPEYSDVLAAFELRGGYDAEVRVRRALDGLGLAGLADDRVVGTLSGGQQVRLHLAAVLAADPEVLLLDEPTNHLDDAAVGWLEEHLRARRGTCVLVSHDRVFLDRVAHALLEVDGGTVTRHGGGYADYLAASTAARARWVQARAEWEDAVAHERESAATTAHRVAPGREMTDNDKMGYGRHRGRVQASESSRVRNARERLRRLVDAEVPVPPEPLRFRVALRARPLTGTVLAADGVSVPGRLAPTSLALPPDGRLLVTGRNGAGKSTLLAVLAGALTPATGAVRHQGRLGLLPQETRLPGPSATVVAHVARGRPGPVEVHAERLRALGLFTAEQLGVRTGTLSTGQRRRLALARLVTADVDVLLLDEPTNHLSLRLVEELESALEAFTGALVVVSHDRRLRARWRGEVLELAAPSEPSTTLPAWTATASGTTSRRAT